MFKRIITILFVLLLFNGCSKNENNTLEFNNILLDEDNIYYFDDSNKNNISINDIYTNEKISLFEKIDIPVFPEKKNPYTQDDFSPALLEEIGYNEFIKGTIYDYVINNETIYFIVKYNINLVYKNEFSIYEYNINDCSLNQIYEFNALIQNIYLFYYDNILYLSVFKYNEDSTIEPKLNWEFTTLDLFDFKSSIINIVDLSKTSIINFKQHENLFQWFEISADNRESGKYVLKCYDIEENKIEVVDENIYLYGSNGDYSKSEYSRAIINDNGKIDIVKENDVNKTIIKTDYDFLEYLWSDDDYYVWVDWGVKQDLTNPTVVYLNTDRKNIASYNIRELGRGISFICTNEKIFIHVLRDTMTAKSDNDFYENIFVIDVKENKCYNITNNFIGNEDSLVKVCFDGMKLKNNYISFYSFENTNPDKFEREEKEIYYLKIN